MEEKRLDYAIETAPEQELHLARPPELVLEEARRAALALKGAVARKRKPVIFKGEQYLEFEDWQTVGKFYGLCARTFEATPVEVFGVKGAKAQAEVVDLRTGHVVGGAEAYCMRDEENWATKPWFQLASMAQTRAGSKALRNILGWVVVLAEYRPTPAEEISGTQDAEPVRIPPTRAPEPHEAGEEGPEFAPEPASKAQIAAIHAIASKLKINPEDVYRAKNFPLHTNELSKKQASQVIEELKGLEKEAEMAK